MALALCNTVVPAISDEGHFVYQVRTCMRMLMHAYMHAAGVRSGSSAMPQHYGTC